MTASFHRLALGLLAAAVAVGGIAALFPPSCELRGRPASVLAPAPDLATQPEPLPSAPLAARPVVDLEAVAAGAEVPRPTGWPPFGDATVAGGELAQSAFIARILPLALMVDEEVLAKRTRLWAVRQLMNGSNHLRPEDRLWLSDAFERYGVEKGDIAALTRRIDAVPPSILIAAAAISTQWNAANEAALRAMAASARSAASEASVAVADPLSPAVAPPLEALRLYLWTINTHPDFAPFRRARERARLGGIPLAGPSLAVTLPRVAPSRLPGAPALAELISDQQLGRFDTARLAPEGQDAAR